MELIDRMEAHGLVRRSRGGTDRREVFVSLTPRGAKLLEKVARQRIGELRASGAALADSIATLVNKREQPVKASERNPAVVHSKQLERRRIRRA